MVKFYGVHKSLLKHDGNCHDLNGYLEQNEIDERDIISIDSNGDFFGVWYRAAKLGEHQNTTDNPRSPKLLALLDRLDYLHFNDGTDTEFIDCLEALRKQLRAGA